jgi:SEC-C motif-containing protein
MAASEKRRSRSSGFADDEGVIPLVTSSPGGPRSADCPCGSGTTYEACCARLHRGEPATSPEQLMRSRYTAFVLRDTDYLLRSWHPGTRPEHLRLDPDLSWLSLHVLSATGDEVEFIARYRGPSGRGFQRERSRFVRSRGGWAYLDGSAS